MNDKYRAMWRESCLDYLDTKGGICVKDLRKTVRSLSQDNQFCGQNLHHIPPDML
jgi:hypothetical protein